MAASAEFELVGCVSRTERSARIAQERHGLDPALFAADLRGALAAHAPDVVLIATPPGTHAELAELALRAGCHVLVEKPIAETVAEARSMVATARAAGRILQVVQNSRYRAAAQAVRRILASGLLGAVGYATIDYRKAPSYPSPAGLHTFGGRRGFAGYRLVEDLSVHHFDLVRGILGAEAAVVTARTLSPSWSWFAHPAAVFAGIELEGGGHVAYNATWVTQGPATNRNGDWRIDCERGQVQWREDRVLVRSPDPYALMFEPGLREGGEQSEALVGELEHEDRAGVLHELASSIAQGRQPETCGEDNLRTLALSLAVARAAEVRRPVAIHELL